ncbi:MAG: hypothetical protein QOJ13_1016 [Gaiellales bacterium]|nr:hypothetical protein [Gaiellales bacterium]
MVLMALACLCAGLYGMIFQSMQGDPRAEGAFRLARLCAVVGGVGGLVGGLTALPYFWMNDAVALRPFLIAEFALLGLTALFAVVIAALLPDSQPERR